MDARVASGVTDGFGQRRPGDGRPRIVIVGAGFAGLNAALALKSVDAEVTVIDRRNYHLFQPLLYQVATAGLSPAQIATPIRAILARQANTTVLMDRVEVVDRQRREVVTRSGRRLSFDWLIVATGARHTYFGRDDWETHAPGLKKISDAVQIRHRVLRAFEEAENASGPEQRRRLLTFCVVGGGPTGVELAGAIAELAHKALTCDFRSIDPTAARVVLVEAGERVLPSFPPSLSAAACRQLAALNVEVVTGSAVTDCDGEGIDVAGHGRIEAATVLWAAGVMASPAWRWLGAEADRAGRVKVTTGLTLPDDPRIFVLGDTAALADAGGRPVPGVAPAAKQMGRYAAAAIGAALAGREALPPFRYRDWGNLATIGRRAAVADFGRLRLSGLPAWLVWSLAHVFFLIGFRNRMFVLLDWTLSYFTFGRGARLIAD